MILILNGTIVHKVSTSILTVKRFGRLQRLNQNAAINPRGCLQDHLTSSGKAASFFSIGLVDSVRAQEASLINFD